jgi:hypothetical protein
MESYQLIIDTSNVLTNPVTPPQGRPPPAESMERMLQSATFGVQMLENAIMQARASEARPTPNRTETESSPEAGNSASSSKKPVGHI